MTGDAIDIARRYALIVDRLSELDVAAIWAASVLGRRPVRPDLAARVVALDALRHDVGVASRERKNARHIQEMSA
jgi:hypothetical protein